ncbi:MAG: VOC family protein [Clostridia bacterium]|nr:VOC family protein [Clostridia bacterium]
MKSRFLHTNINVLDLERSIGFYGRALALHEVRRIAAPDGSFTLVFLGDSTTDYLLELTWQRGRSTPYNLGDNEWHVVFRVDDREAEHALHKEMGCICYENTDMGLYFISDPDGYWIEILS